jgi:hypothetical protein
MKRSCEIQDMIEEREEAVFEAAKVFVLANGASNCIRMVPAIVMLSCREILTNIDRIDLLDKYKSELKDVMGDIYKSLYGKKINSPLGHIFLTSRLICDAIGILDTEQFGEEEA